MKNSKLFLKCILCKKIGLVVFIWMAVIQLLYFKNAIISYDINITFVDINIYLLNNIRAIIFYISPTFLMLLYFIFNHYEFKIFEVSRFQNKWKWFLNDLKKVFLITMMFLFFMCLINLIFSIGKIPFDSKITLKEADAALIISIKSINAYIILILNYILMGGYLLSLALIFITLGLVLKHKEIIVGIIMIFLPMNKAIFYKPLSDVGDLTFLNSAMLMEEFKGTDIRVAFLVKFLYFMILISLNLILNYKICTRKKIKLYKKNLCNKRKNLILKSLNLKSIILWSFIAISICLLFIINNINLNSLEIIFYNILKEPNKNIYNISIFIVFYGSLTTIIGKVLYKESRQSLLFYLVRNKSIKNYLKNLIFKGILVIFIYYTILVVLVLISAKFVEITAIGSISIIITYITKSILLSIIFMLFEIVGLVILKQEWFGILMFLISIIFHNFIQLSSQKMMYLSLISYNISTVNIKFYTSIIIFLLIITISIASIFIIASRKDNIYFVQ